MGPGPRVHQRADPEERYATTTMTCLPMAS